MKKTSTSDALPAATSTQTKLEPTFHTLSNGLRVVLCPLAHLHSVGIGLYTRVGARYENPKEMGVSHFLEHVLFRGNARYPTSFEMNRAFEGWGGSLNGFTTREYTYYFGKLHPDYLHEAIPFMGDFVREPSFEGVELERQIILEERLEDVDEDGQDLEVDDVSRAALWGQHPLGHKIIGTPNSIRWLQQTHLIRHFKRFYCGKHLVLCLTGAFDSEQVMPLIEASFGSLPTHGEEHPLLAAPEGGPKERFAFVSHDSSQVSLQLSFRGLSPKERNFASMLLIDRVLDDGMSSRLWQRIVEEKGLCYEVWAGLDVYHDASLIDIGASVAPEKVVELVDRIVQELRQLREEGPSEDEFQFVRRRWRYSLEYAFDHVESLNERLGASLLYDLYLPFEEQISRMESVTREEFSQVCRDILCPENFLLAGVGPLTKSTKRKLRDVANSL